MGHLEPQKWAFPNGIRIETLRDCANLTITLLVYHPDDPDVPRAFKLTDHCEVVKTPKGPMVYCSSLQGIIGRLWWGNYNLRDIKYLLEQ